VVKFLELFLRSSHSSGVLSNFHQLSLLRKHYLQLPSKLLQKFILSSNDLMAQQLRTGAKTLLSQQRWRRTLVNRSFSSGNYPGRDCRSTTTPRDRPLRRRSEWPSPATAYGSPVELVHAFLHHLCRCGIFPGREKLVSERTGIHKVLQCLPLSVYGVVVRPSPLLWLMYFREVFRLPIANHSSVGTCSRYHYSYPQFLRFHKRMY